MQGVDINHIFEIRDPCFSIHLATYMALLRRLTSETADVKGEIERTFSKSRPKSAKFWRFSASGGQGLEKVSIFTSKGHPCVNLRRLSHFS